MADLKIWFILLTILASVNAEGPASSPLIHTEPSVVGWKDLNIQFPCNFSGTPYSVYWHKYNETDPTSSGTLKANLWLNKINSFDDRFEMSEDFTLRIDDLVVADEGRYICQVALEDKSDLESFTDLQIYAYSGKPLIDQCVDKPKDCEYQWHGSSGFTLDCSVSGFKPNLTKLVWTTAGRGELALTKDVQRRLPDGTWKREVTITANAKKIEQDFICTARGDAVSNGTASTRVTVLPLLIVPTKKSLPAGGIAGIVIVVLLVPICLIGGYFFWKSRRNRDETDISPPSAQPLVSCETADPEDIEIGELREKIGNYKPGDAMGVPITADVSAVNINLFGLMGVGKSAFFNSLNFAFRGTYDAISPEGSADSSGAVTQDRMQNPLTKNINLNDNRGMRSFETSYTGEAEAQVEGRRGVNPAVRIAHNPKDEIHCVVFVYEYRDMNWSEAVTFVNAFFETMFRHYGRYPLFVFTHGNKAESQFEDLKEKLTKYNVPEANIWMFENYTSKNHEENKERSLEFLKFLWAALKQCDLNINHVERKKRETPEAEEEPQVAWYWKMFGY